MKAIHTIGRRKSSVARVFLKPGKGVITMNGLPYQDYLGRDALNMLLRQPLEVTETMEKYDFVINVSGGGKSGQAGAAKLGIARALLKVEETARKTLKPLGLLTRDPREVERKKYGRHKARKRPQFSKR
jgi:small subunit ribosomal protein S9